MEVTLTDTWIIDELKSAGKEHLDEVYVRNYDHKAQFDPTDDIHHLRQLGLSIEDSIIDFGSGTGTFAMAVAPYCKAVIAVDPSPAMNARLQDAIVKAGIRNLSIVSGGFLSYQPSSEPVDFIFTRHALHHLPDFWKVMVLSKMHSMLAPQGIIRIKDLIFDFQPEETKEKLEAWMSGAVDDSTLGWTADELAEHVREEYSTFSWIFELMLQRTGFEIIDRDYQRNVYGAYTCRVLPS
jgi:ubiquinone/menaquinone biosynthesis C-methylase UbiE